MSDQTFRKSEAASRKSTGDYVATGGIVASHTLQHLYGQGFYVILPLLYTSMGLTPIAAGFIGTVRQVSSGIASMLGGFIIDRIQHRRVLVLYISLVMMGTGYFFMALAPTYFLILLALALAGAAGSIWHPAALSLLSQRYAGRRGFILAIHRSTGNAGDILGPLIVGALLQILVWQKIVTGALPLAVAFALLLFAVLRKAQGWQKSTDQNTAPRTLREQTGTLKDILRNRELIVLLLVSGVAGLGQGSIMLWLPLYLQETQGMGSLGIGLHLGLLSVVGIATGPLFGILSDRIGRSRIILIVLIAKALIATLMAIVASGTLFTILVGIMGAFIFAVNPLVQAGALDIAEGRKLEGSMIGLLWGNNALFSGASPVLVGFLITSLGYGVLFWYIVAMNTVAAILAFILTIISANK